MNGKVAILVGLVAVGGGLAYYGKTLSDAISEDISYELDKTSVSVYTKSFSQVGLYVDLVVRNESDIELEAKNFKLKILTDSGKNLATVNKSERFVLDSNSIVPINLNLDFDPKELFSDSLKGLDLLNYKDIPLTFKGSVKVYKFGVWIPVKFKFSYKLGELI